MDKNGTTTQNPDASTSTTPPLKVVQPRSRPHHALPTDRVAHAKQQEILRAFAVASEQHGNGPVTYKQVADLVKMHPATPPLATMFFVDIGLLFKSGQQGFTPAQEVLTYAQAWQWNPATAATKLLPIFSRAWFARTVMPQLNLNGSMTVEAAIQELSINSGASKEYRAQLDGILDWMTTVGMIAKEGNMIRRVGPSSAAEPAPNEGDKVEIREPKQSPPPMISTALQSTQGQVRFNVNVTVDMGEFAGWQPDRISAFFAGIAAVLAAKADVERQTARQ